MLVAVPGCARRRCCWRCAPALLALRCPRRPCAAAWTADPDDQFLLDVNIRQLKLGDGVRAYNAPEGTCVVLGDFLTALDVPMHIDLTARKASGWAFKETNRIAIDYGGDDRSLRREKRADRARHRPRDARRLVRPDDRADSLVRNRGQAGHGRLGAGAAIGRQVSGRARRSSASSAPQQLRPASFDLKSLPQVRIPYRMWRAPALDFVVSAGVTYRANDGVRVDRQSSVYAAGEIARMSYDAQITTNAKGIPSTCGCAPIARTRTATARSAQGDPFRLWRRRRVRQRPDRSGGERAGPRRHQPAAGHPGGLRPHPFRGRFAAPAGKRKSIAMESCWVSPSPTPASVMCLTMFSFFTARTASRSSSTARRARPGRATRLIDIGKDNVPAGKTWYWAGFNQPARTCSRWRSRRTAAALPKAQATVSVEHGIDARTSVGAFARMMLIDDQRLTFLEGSVRRSIGGALIEVGAARESERRTWPPTPRLLGKFGPVNVSAEAVLANDFHLRGRESGRACASCVRARRAGQARPGRCFPAHADLHLTDRRDGSSSSMPRRGSRPTSTASISRRTSPTGGNIWFRARRRPTRSTSE